MLPLGSVIYLEEGNQKIMIVGRGVVYEDEETGESVFVDYMGCPYPEGIDPNQTIFFNEENVDEVIYEGYKGKEEDRFLEVYGQWESTLQIPKKIIK